MRFKETAVILPGGGMKNAYISILLMILRELKIISLSDFTRVYAQSSAGTTALFNLLGQDSDIIRVWREELTSRRVFGPGSLYATKGRWLGDTEHLINHCCRDLELERLKDIETSLMIGVVDSVTGKMKHFRLNDYDPPTMRKILRASCAVPLICSPVEVEESLFVDGGLHTLLPVEKAIEDGYKKIIVFLNRPVHVLHENHQRETQVFEWFHRKNPKIIETYRGRSRRYNDALRKLSDMEEDGDAIVIAPDEELPIRRFDWRRHKVSSVSEIARADSARHIERIVKFLRIEKSLV